MVRFIYLVDVRTCLSEVGEEQILSFLQSSLYLQLPTGSYYLYHCVGLLRCAQAP